MIAVAIGAAVIASCAGDATPSVPARAFASLRAGDTVRVDAETLAQDAVEPAALLALLDAAGFVDAVERTFVGSEDIRSVTARVVAFSSEEGARRYLGWLRTHADDLLGEADEGSPVELAGEVSGMTFTSAPGGCCAKATTTSLAAWRRGSAVLTVIAAGPGAGATGISELAGDFDDATTAEGGT